MATVKLIGKNADTGEIEEDIRLATGKKIVADVIELTGSGELRVTARGSTLFSPDASTVGIDNIAGGYPARVIAYDNDTRKITLESTDNDDLLLERYIAGQPINVILELDDDAGRQIHEIESAAVVGGTIEVVLTTVLDTIGGEIPVVDENSTVIAIVDFPDCDVASRAAGQGNVSIGESSSAEGSYNLICGLANTGSGVLNILIGDFLTTSGMFNVLEGTYIKADGSNNKAKGMFLHLAGNGNEFTGDNSFVLGDNNTSGVHPIFTNSHTAIIGSSNQDIAGIGNVVVGNNNSINAMYTVTVGYKLKNYADGSIMLGRYAELEDSPENKYAFAVGGGDIANPDMKAFIMRSRKKVLNPMYDPAKDPEATGIDTDGEHQYIAEMAFAGQYKGRMIGTTQTVADASGSVSLDHDFFNRWKITPSASVTPVLENWLDADTGQLIIYNGGSYFQFPVEWNWIGTQPTLTSNGYDVFTIEQIDNDIFIKHEVTK